MAASIFDARYVQMDTLSNPISTGTPVLAIRAGIYCERQAEGTLARLFCCTWTHILPSDFQGQVAIVPDGSCDLIFAGGRLVIVGPDRVAAFPDLERGETVLGLRLRPGAALRWLDMPLSQIVGMALPLAVLRDDISEIEERLAATPDTADRLALLHAWAERQADIATEAQPDMDLLFTGLLQGRVDEHTLSGIGERTFRRRAHDHFGYGPKTLHRILRLQHMLRLAASQKRDSLAMIAHAAGYADQSHMTRDVRELTTLTPLDICRQLSSSPRP